MPSKVTATWNPMIGCLHCCRYCFARDLALGRLRHLPRYRAGFKPALVEQELGKRFQKGLIFVSDMGDLWGKWVPGAWYQ